MTLKTVQVGLRNEAVHRYLNAIDDEGCDYHLVRKTIKRQGSPDTNVTLQLWVEGVEDTMEITLDPDGTWSVTTHLTVSEG